MIESIRHTGIVVKDLDKAVAFYEALGFTTVDRKTESGQFIEAVTGVSGAVVEWAKLSVEDGQLLELLTYNSDVSGQMPALQPSAKLGCSHVAFTVSSIDRACEVIRNNGGSLVNPAALSPDGKVQVCYCHDSEGVLLELVEVL